MMPAEGEECEHTMLEVDLGKYMYAEMRRRATTCVWSVISKSSDDELGQVQWYARWRQYCFYPNYGMVFNSTCMQSLTKFLDIINQKHRDWKARKRLAERHRVAGPC